MSLVDDLNTFAAKQNKTPQDQAKKAIIDFARNHDEGGNLTASIFGALGAYQPLSESELFPLREELDNLRSELEYKSESIFNGGELPDVATAEKHKAKGKAEAYIRLYDKINAPDVLPLGAIELAKKIAANIITPFDENRVLRKSVSTPAMKWGHENEIIALNELSEMVARDGFTLTPLTFYALSGIGRTGATPDFTISNGAIKIVGDIKSPLNNEVHIETILRGNNTDQLKKDESGYYWQFTGQMLCSGVREHWKISFNPSFPVGHPLRLHKSVMLYNEEDAAFLLSRIKMFWAHVQTIIDAVEKSSSI